jgi:hypothetical protein
MADDYLKKIVLELKDLESYRGGRRTRMDEEIRKAGLENDSREQDINLKRKTLITLFWFLALETVVIFSFSYLQATKTWGFTLEEWSFKLLLAATISQITFMLQVAVKHLFPQK